MNTLKKEGMPVRELFSLLFLVWQRGSGVECKLDVGRDFKLNVVAELL